MEENPDFVAVDPQLLEEGGEERVRVSDFGRVVVPSKREMMEKTRGLDKDQRKVVDIAVQYAKDIIKARSRGRAPPETPHLMVHGSAGTGEIYIINAHHTALNTSHILINIVELWNI